MLSEFDSSSNAFRNWKQQVDFLRDPYNLNDNATRVLISSKLKEKAISWFHSKPEHITLNAVNLMEESRDKVRETANCCEQTYGYSTWRIGRKDEQNSKRDESHITICRIRAIRSIYNTLRRITKVTTIYVRSDCRHRVADKLY